MRNVRLLGECRAVAGEVGSFAEAWQLPTEVRTWWVSEMMKEREGDGSGNGPPSTSSDGRRIVRSDVPRGNRG